MKISLLSKREKRLNQFIKIYYLKKNMKQVKTMYVLSFLSLLALILTILIVNILY